MHKHAQANAGEAQKANCISFTSGCKCTLLQDKTESQLGIVLREFQGELATGNEVPCITMWPMDVSWNRKGGVITSFNPM
jgi:hypothetical protein